MKENNGITLLSLTIYIIVMLIVIVIMGNIINSFYANNINADMNLKDLLRVNKFNTYFLKEIKFRNNNIDTIEQNYILFSSGNSFQYMNNCVFLNNKKICEKVEKFEISNNENIININIKIGSYEKTMKYVVENIY